MYSFVIIRFWNYHMKAQPPGSWKFKANKNKTSSKALLRGLKALLILSFLNTHPKFGIFILQGKTSDAINPINPSTTPIVPASKPQDASDKLQPLKSSLVGWNVTPLSIILETLSYREANNPLFRSWFVHFPGVQNEGTYLPKWIHPSGRESHLPCNRGLFGW